MTVSLEQFLCAAMLVPLADPRDSATIWGVPINLVGLSGIGKTARIRAVGKAIGVTVHPVYAATKQPEDFSGALVPTPDGVIVECILPAARKCIAEGSGIIHLDEISCARPATQSALLSFVDERRIGDQLLPPKVRTLLSMNPPEYAAGGHDLEPPLANRMGWKEMTPPTVSSWSSWLLDEQGEDLEPLTDGEARVRMHFHNVWPGVKGLATAFMHAKGDDMLHDQPKPDDDKSSGPWPSPRTWTWALRAIATVRCLQLPSDLELEFVQCLVGEGPALEWAEYAATANLPDPQDMLTKGWKANTQRLDISFGAINAMIDFVKSRPDAKEQEHFAVAAWKIIEASVNVLF